MAGARNAVCLSVDARMLIPALFVADAVRKAAPRGGSDFDTIIFAPGEDVTDTHRQWARGRGIVFCHDLNTNSISDIKILMRRFSIAAVMKLLVPEHLAGRYRKVLHLDADLTIHADVSTLFDLDMGDRALAAVPAARIPAASPPDEWKWWQGHFKALGMTFPYRYFNAGVMLMETENWVRHDLTARTLAFIRQNPSICFFPEEDALNAVLDGDLVELSPIWNFRPPLPPAFRDLIVPAIVHHAGPGKPWKRFGRNRRFLRPGDEYRQYVEFVRQTPWPEWLSTQWAARDFFASARYELKRQFAADRDGRSLFAHFKHYLAEAEFADVRQGIVVRENGAISPSVANVWNRPATHALGRAANFDVH